MVFRGEPRTELVILRAANSYRALRTNGTDAAVEVDRVDGTGRQMLRYGISTVLVPYRLRLHPPSSYIDQASHRPAKTLKSILIVLRRRRESMVSTIRARWWSFARPEERKKLDEVEIRIQQNNVDDDDNAAIILIPA
ncbi:hypothetical protein U1Q18_044898 [Sarracenia purpurea var. burkii]